MNTNMDSSGAGVAAGAALFSGLFLLVWLAVVVLCIAGMWRMFSKAGQPGWASIIPILNTYFLIKIGGKPGWWLLLLLIPFVNIIIWILITAGIAKNFGKGVGFILGLLFLPFIFFLILGFGDATYNAPPA